MAFFDELAANATEKDVKVVIYLGNDDTVVPHLSSESKFKLRLVSSCLVSVLTTVKISHYPGMAA